MKSGIIKKLLVSLLLSVVSLSALIPAIAVADDIPNQSYAVISPSSSSIYKGQIALRIDLYLDKSSPYYDKFHLYSIDYGSLQWLAGYNGLTDALGYPISAIDYQNWLNNLPHEWRNTPFHSHFLYFDSYDSDIIIKAKIRDTCEYFYSFYRYAWDTHQDFTYLWQRVPRIEGTIREPLEDKYISPAQLQANRDRFYDILSRSYEFQTSSVNSVDDLNIGTKGTIDIGAEAIDRTTYI